MPCILVFCGGNTTRDPESPNENIVNNPFQFMNVEPNRRASLTDIPLNRVLASELEIIEVNSSLPAVFYNPDSSEYNMNGEKLIYIFGHENYLNTSHFKRPPPRNGTRYDANLMAETFEICGFRFKIYNDMEYKQIIDIISRVSQQDHTRTSCLWVTIMTHATSNALLAADRPYMLSQIEALLQSANLAGIPKILTLPCLRGGDNWPAFNDRLPLRNSATWAVPLNTAMSLWYGSIDWVHKFYHQVFKEECTTCTVCDRSNVDEGRVVILENGNTTVLPSTADFLFIHAADNDQVSLSNLIRAICEALRENPELKDEDLILIINQKVASNTNPPSAAVIPETRNTLTEAIRFIRIESHRN